MNRLICLLLALIFTLSACSVQTDPEPTEHISWSVVEEIVKHERFFDSADKKEWIPLRDTLRQEIDKRKLERWK